MIERALLDDRYLRRGVKESNGDSMTVLTKYLHKFFDESLDMWCDVAGLQSSKIREYLDNKGAI